MKLVIVSGLSGSGKTVALHTLEDLGFYSIDNLPLFLLKDLTQGLGPERDEVFQRTAVGIDARTETADLAGLPGLLAAARERGIDTRLIFVDAHSDALMRRFSETRRRHPLTSGGDRTLADAIKLERKLLEPVAKAADVRIDTTLTNVHELRELVRAGIDAAPAPKASILLQSFGFKHGVPQDVDFVFDVRCLPNPHWQEELRHLTGLDQPVIDYLEASAHVRDMRDDIAGYFDRWVPVFETDGRSYLTLAVGCTGGHHRSVYMVEALRAHFEQAGYQVMVRHRELP